MSRTATATSQALAEWVKVFPKQPTQTYTSSVKFMKQLTAVAMSTITYVRNLFSEENFTVENFGGFPLRILKEKCRDEVAQFVSTSLVQAFDAFEKKYLHKLALCFYDGECKIENLIEYYIFEYSYKVEGVTVDITTQRRGKSDLSRYTFDSIQRSTIQLIRTCVTMAQPNHDLPEICDVSLRLYYNDDAPSGYQAPGFSAPPEAVDPLAGAYVRLGRVSTRFHSVSAAACHLDTQASRNAQPSENTPVMTQNEEDDSMMWQISQDDISEPNPETLIESGSRVDCPCAKTDDCGDLLMLTCDYCGTRQHAACFGRRGARGGTRGGTHCCTRCHDADAKRRATDTQLLDLTHVNRERLCIFRRTLEWCSGLSAVDLEGLAAQLQLSPINAAKIVNRLIKSGVLENTDIDIMLPRKISPEKLNSEMSVYFYPEEPESAEARGTRSDPVADVLRPMEAVSLQNATTLGKMIEPPLQDFAMKEATLNQYNEVILSGNQTDENLSPCGNHDPVKDMEMVGHKTHKRKAKVPRAGVMTKRTKTS